MPITNPTPVSSLPTPPTASNPSSFDVLADGFIAALPAYREQINALATNVYNNAVAIASEIGASSVWISAQVYTVGQVRFSPLNNRNYRCIIQTTISDTTDPSLDSVKWAPVVPNIPGAYVYTAQTYGVL